MSRLRKAAVRPRRLSDRRREARGALWARANSKVFTKN